MKIQNFHFLGLIRNVGKMEEVQGINNLSKLLLNCGKSGQKSRFLQIIAGENNERGGRPFIILNKTLLGI